MESLHGVIDSQSRYELQQRVLFNPYALAPNITNRFGQVDSSNRISLIKSISNRDRIEINQPNTSQMPILSVDELGSGLNAFYLDEDNYLDGTYRQAYSQLEWDIEFYIAFKFKMPSTSLANSNLIAIRDSSFPNDGIRISQRSNGAFWMQMRSTLGGANDKRIITDTTYKDDAVHDAICYFSGTNDANDYIFYIDGSPVSYTVINNADLTGENIFGSIDTRWQSGYVGNSLTDIYLGKIILGIGAPNIPLITKSLNSPTT